MTKEDFENLWNASYPKITLASVFHFHRFQYRDQYPDRWFRIHSLPQSKRYADSLSEWRILLNRQNKVITDLFGVNRTIFIVISTHENSYYPQKSIDQIINKTPNIGYLFQKLSVINLKDIEEMACDEDTFCQPYFTQTRWIPKKHNRILEEIANENLRAFFVSFDPKLIIDPYDGGIDFILQDAPTRDFYKEKYKEYLSPREDGF